MVERAPRLCQGGCYSGFEIEPTSARSRLLAAARLLSERGYVVAADGNLSLRVDHGILITPSQVPYALLREEDMVEVWAGGAVSGQPSTELAVHLAIYQNRPEVGAIIHAHPVHACVLSTLRLPLPPLLDEVTPVLGGEVRVSPYAPPGSEALGELAVEALAGRTGAILANHGTVTVGADLDEAFSRLEVLERAAQVYVLALGTGLELTLPG